MKRNLWLEIAAVAAAAMSLSASAHHAVQAQFDVGKTDTLSGKLAKVELVNPHPYLYFDVKGADKMVQWEIEAPALIALRRLGLIKRLKVGETYTIQYAPARNGTPLGLIRAITLPDGQTIVTSAAEDFGVR
jgi:hypothetical protein